MTPSSPPPPAPAPPAFDWIDPPDGMLYELLDGRPVMKRTSFYASWLATHIAMRLSAGAETRGGYVIVRAPLLGFLGRPDHHRRPDVSYFSRTTLPILPADGPVAGVVPDLVAEVVSPGDSAEEVEAKIQEYLAAGVKVLWFVFPQSKVVRVHHADGLMRLLNITGTLDGATAMPGFSCVVGDLFPRS